VQFPTWELILALLAQPQDFGSVEAAINVTSVKRYAVLTAFLHTADIKVYIPPVIPTIGIDWAEMNSDSHVSLS
jgi:hypothetical protein